jgi:ParB-like chromosome segregation protein Spo0J
MHTTSITASPKANKRTLIREAIEADPNQTNTAIAKRFGAARDTVIAVRRVMANERAAPAPASPVSYQVMPALSDDDYAALKADIEARGVMVPVEYDEHGTVLDGHHRVKACHELGIEQWPRLVRRGLTDEGKRAHARALNLARRHLTQAQRRDLVAGQLRETPQLSDRQIAAMLGVSPSTVGPIRSDLEARGDVSRLDTRNDSKGRKQPATKPKTEKPKRTAYVSEREAAVANSMPKEEREAVLSGSKTARQVIAEQSAEERFEEMRGTPDDPVDPLPEKPDASLSRTFYELMMALRTLATSPIKPDELQDAMPRFQWSGITQWLEGAHAFVTDLNTSWERD